MFGDYDPDEALRIVSVSAMFEGDTYVCRVHNSGGRFMVMLEEHQFPRGFFETEIKRCKHTADPCAAESRNLKDAIRRVIAEHHHKVPHVVSNS